MCSSEELLEMGSVHNPRAWLSMWEPCGAAGKLSTSLTAKTEPGFTKSLMVLFSLGPCP